MLVGWWRSHRSAGGVKQVPADNVQRVIHPRNLSATTMPCHLSSVKPGGWRTSNTSMLTIRVIPAC
eukprot:170996-Pyramimonas_sp.AAC.1